MKFEQEFVLLTAWLPWTILTFIVFDDLTWLGRISLIGCNLFTWLGMLSYVIDNYKKEKQKQRNN